MSGTILFVVGQTNNCKVGLPPTAYLDDFNTRAIQVGKLDNVRLIAFSPDGKLYAVCGRELYAGPMPTDPSQNWLNEAKRVGKCDWDGFKLIFFHPNGMLYAVTHKGELFHGPSPSNEHKSWLFSEAKKIGAGGWNMFVALFFDQSGTLYGVTKDRFVKRSPPSSTSEKWYQTSTTIGLGSGWSNLSHFMAFNPDGNLWCVSKDDGKIFTASPPTHAQDDWISRAKNLGVAYHNYKLMSFTTEKTIQRILDLEFLVDIGKIISLNTELVAEQVYDNTTSSVTLDATFTVNKSYEATSSFTQEHGLTFGFNAETTFQTGIPIIVAGSLNVGLEMSTTHNWCFTGSNTNKTDFSTQFHFRVAPGKAVRQTVLVQKAITDVPYRAKVCTLFGNETTMCGMWKGACYFNLHVKQVDV
ncbi:uncharacterized protein LOC142467694 [Ascaphus truei]|uniref:uncharacterized protein LOC142467694 n=1 Tax=Ascaphus truei TaxID=8439 RepID=UPI003F5A1427